MVKIEYMKTNYNVSLIIIFGFIMICAITFISFYTTRANILSQYAHDGEKITTIFTQNLNQTALSFEYFKTIDFTQQLPDVLRDFRKTAKIAFNQSNILNTIGLVQQFHNKTDAQIKQILAKTDANLTLKVAPSITKETTVKTSNLHAIVYEIYPPSVASLSYRGLNLRSEKYRDLAITNMENANFSITHPVSAFDAKTGTFKPSSILFYGAYKLDSAGHTQWIIAAAITFETFIKNFISLSPLFQAYTFSFSDTTTMQEPILLFANTTETVNNHISDEFIEFGGRVYKLSIFAPSIYTIANFWQPILGFVSGLLFLILIGLYLQYKINNEEQLSVAKNKLLKAEQIGKMGHFTLNADDLCITCSHEIVQMLELDSQTIQFDDLRRIVSSVDFANMQLLIEKLQNEEFYNEGNFEFQAIVNNKTKFFKVIYNAHYVDAQLSEVFGITQDITDQKEMEIAITNQKEHFKKLATTDYLTKIYNRVYISDVITNLIHQNKRYGQIFSIILFDIDHFKNINDTYGHLEGDKVLVGIVESVTNSIRETDMFARWGGEEFLLILNNTDLENAHWVAQNLRIAIEKLKLIENQQITCSFGVSSIKDGDTEDSLLQRVDSLLYVAKGSGRNRVVQG